MTTSRILIHRRDEKLDDEVRATVAGISNWNTSLHFHSDLRSTINAATSYQPNLVVIELNESILILGCLNTSASTIQGLLCLHLFRRCGLTFHFGDFSLGSLEVSFSSGCINGTAEFC